MEQLSVLKSLLNTLDVQRTMLQIEADAIHSELTSPTPEGGPPVGLKGTLVDAEGFPRGDVDLYNVKLKRKRLAEINTDYKSLMKRIETTMTDMYSLKQQFEEITTTSVDNPTTSSSVILAEDIQKICLKPKAIAIIDQVFDGSPAETAGLKSGDYLLDFGGINSNYNVDERGYLSAVAKIVSDSVGKGISITILRNQQDTMIFMLTPQTWAGRGLLGCHLSPLSLN
mmetsp:Transcript_29089/g.39957  ORF Transcript_29089/g.39957 Transcript_29089/m.39957 type:complete len:227 (+) Transcript_29089:19-699(+)